MMNGLDSDRILRTRSGQCTSTGARIRASKQQAKARPELGVIPSPPGAPETARPRAGCRALQTTDTRMSRPVRVSHFCDSRSAPSNGYAGVEPQESARVRCLLATTPGQLSCSTGRHSETIPLTTTIFIEGPWRYSMQPSTKGPRPVLRPQPGQSTELP